MRAMQVEEPDLSTAVAKQNEVLGEDADALW